MSGLLMAASLWRRLGCCVAGHDYAITSDRTRMFVRCRQCGRTSRGLEMAESPFHSRPRPERMTTTSTSVAAKRSDFAA